MLEKMMQTAVTAFRNGEFMALVLNEKDLETYRAVYIRTYDFGVSDGMRSAGTRCPAIDHAIEDAEFDLGIAR